MRSATRRPVLARISPVTTPAGRWVARIRCTPRERPTRAMRIKPVTKSGSSCTSSANSSITSTSRARPMVAARSGSCSQAVFTSAARSWCRQVSRRRSSASSEASARWVSRPSRLVTSPTV